MKKAFYGSLVHHGIRGGAIIIDEGCLVYKNQTATLEAEYKNIRIPFQEIERVEPGNLFLFPTMTVYLKDEREYKFVIFNRKRFLEEMRNKIE